MAFDVQKLPEFLHPREVANILNITDRSLANKRRRGEGPPFIKIAHNQIRYSLSGLLEWIEQEKAKPVVRKRRPSDEHGRVHCRSCGRVLGDE